MPEDPKKKKPEPDADPLQRGMRREISLLQEHPLSGVVDEEEIKRRLERRRQIKLQLEEEERQQQNSHGMCW